MLTETISLQSHTLPNEIKSVLYLDFDNIYTRLYEIDPSIGYAFASLPSRWIKWLEGHALKILYGEQYKRRLLKRVCYMNTNRFQEFRTNFMRAGFTITDCPPITNQGKTSADIHLVMDCMDDMLHPSNFHEFIFLSGDADFTPLLLRLQEYSRRTLLLHIGAASSLYTNVATWKIREDWFIKQAILESDIAPTTTPVLEKPSVDTVPNINLSNHTQAVQLILDMLEESNTPVPIASVACMLQSQLDADDNWFGYGKLKDFLHSLHIDTVEFSTTPPGYLLIPGRHTLPEQNDHEKAFSTAYPTLYPFAHTLHTITAIPLLTPEQYRTIIAFLAEEINSGNFVMTTASKHIRDKCASQGVHVARSNINFIIIGIAKYGYTLSEVNSLTVEELVTAFVHTIQTVAEENDYTLSSHEVTLLTAWVSGTYKEE